MSHQRDREDTIARLTAEGWALQDIRALLRSAATVQRIAVLACNRELDKTEEKADARACARVEELGKKYGCRVKCSGDPRGYCVKVLLPSGAYNTWGGPESGWGIPARG